MYKDFLCHFHNLTHFFVPKHNLAIEKGIVRLRQLSCSIAQSNHFLVRATKIYIILAPPGKYKSTVSLQQSYHSSNKTSKIKTCLN